MKKTQNPKFQSIYFLLPSSNPMKTHLIKKKKKKPYIIHLKIPF